MLIPLGGQDVQTLVVLTRKQGTILREDMLPVRFVPLLGQHGWKGY